MVYTPSQSNKSLIKYRRCKFVIYMKAFSLFLSVHSFLRMKWCELQECKWNEDMTIVFESQFKQLQSSPRKTFFRALMGFEPIPSVFALQCSTNWAMKTHTWRAGQFIDLVYSINWPALHVWVFKAHLVEHSSVNAEATDSNPIEALLFHNC